MLHTFLEGYWNQMASEIYRDFDDALLDFCATEGGEAYGRLLREFRECLDAGRFPSRVDLKSAYSDAFWRQFSCILVREDLETSALLKG